METQEPWSNSFSYLKCPEEYIKSSTRESGEDDIYTCYHLQGISPRVREVRPRLKEDSKDHNRRCENIEEEQSCHRSQTQRSDI